MSSQEHFKNGGMFRTNAQALDTNITILATENAQVTGTLTINSGHYIDCQ